MNVWFREDVRNILLALEECSARSLALARGAPGVAEYAAGYRDCLREVGRAFGLGRVEIGFGCQIEVVAPREIVVK